MAEEIMEVNQDEAPIEEVQPQEEQTEEQVEALSQPVDGKDYKKIAEQLSKDIQDKNRKIQELKNQPKAQPVISEDETVQRFLKTEANATIALMMQTDPSFKDRAEVVKSYVEQGYDINMADKLAKADIMDQILKNSSTPVQPNIPKQQQPTAIPEQVKPQPTGNNLDDIIDGKVEMEIDNADALREVLKKYRPAQ